MGDFKFHLQKKGGTVGLEKTFKEILLIENLPHAKEIYNLQSIDIGDYVDVLERITKRHAKNFKLHQKMVLCRVPNYIRCFIDHRDGQKGIDKPRIFIEGVDTGQGVVITVIDVQEIKYTDRGVYTTWNPIFLAKYKDDMRDIRISSGDDIRLLSIPRSLAYRMSEHFCQAYYTLIAYYEKYSF